ncbi:MAG: glycosyltransferase [Muribaculaceae bacterium]|nr:glycosyltransferase [Muribaculaceae bacterium]
MRHYDIIFLTNLPSFYKINLFNEISRKQKILVLFTNRTAEVRNKDFFSGEKFFDSEELPTGNYAKIKYVNALFKNIEYDRLVISGWDEPISYYLAFKSSRKKNSVIVESSIYESSVTGVKGLLKRIFLRRISRGYVPGEANSQLLKALRFKGEIIKTHGVGVFNYLPQAPYTPCSDDCNRFLYVGRLSPEKNLNRVINVFNRNPQWTLSIIGFGPQEAELKSLAAENVKFIGAVDNLALPSYYRSHDTFILASVSEPWGLVVEEALNNGLPVAGSEVIGCADDWLKDKRFGITFNPMDEFSIECALKIVSTPDNNNRLRQNISKLNFADIELKQVQCYLLK